LIDDVTKNTTKHKNGLIRTFGSSFSKVAISSVELFIFFSRRFFQVSFFPFAHIVAKAEVNKDMPYDEVDIHFQINISWKFNLLLSRQMVVYWLGDTKIASFF